ncbi:cell growth regulator with RING finger domain protein 1 [Caerostris extrusa]|uniref:Cell growth regulator with RING finger domain protein 1 n=1 Tax=Caerostris extrusa TaxID=172846 RepID=A0AAV4MG75_CAEEX|nr:cell growth regulator with RING finger domain protein 1 [Caerostris extrusa]
MENLKHQVRHILQLGSGNNNNKHSYYIVVIKFRSHSKPVYDFKYVFKKTTFHWLAMLIIASILLYMFHLYFQTLNSGGIHYVNTERSALNMQVFHNPFTFEVNLQEATYSGIQCKFHGEKDFYLLTVWGVPIYQLFMLLNSTPRNLKHSISTLVKKVKNSVNAAKALMIYYCILMVLIV